MKTIDTNEDGKISVEELIAYITKGASQLLAKSAGAGAVVFAQASQASAPCGMVGPQHTEAPVGPVAPLVMVAPVPIMPVMPGGSSAPGPTNTR